MRRLPGLGVVAARVGGCWIGIVRTFGIAFALGSKELTGKTGIEVHTTREILSALIMRTQSPRAERESTQTSDFDEY